MASLSDLIGWMGGGAAAVQLIDYALKRGERRAASRKNMLDEVGKLWERIDQVEAEADDERKKRRDIEDLMADQAKQIQHLQAVTLQRDQAIKERDTAVLERDVAILERDEARRLRLEDSEKNNARIIALEEKIVALESQVQQLQAQLDDAQREQRLDHELLKGTLNEGDITNG
jgi:chromosome segregation ATPase